MIKKETYLMYVFFFEKKKDTKAQILSNKVWIAINSFWFFCTKFCVRWPKKRSKKFRQGKRKLFTWFRQSSICIWHASSHFEFLELKCTLNEQSVLSMKIEKYFFNLCDRIWEHCIISIARGKEKWVNQIYCVQQNVRVNRWCMTVLVFEEFAKM